MNEAGSAPAAQPLGLFARFVGVITAPRATFESVVAHPRPIGILFICALIIGIASAAPQFTESGRQAMLDTQIRQVEQMTGQPVGAEQLARMEQMGSMNVYFALIGTFIFLPVMSLIMAAVYWALFNAIMGGTASFKQVLAIVTHAQVIAAIGVAIGVPFQIMQGTMSMGGPFNLGALVSFLDEGSAIARFLGAVSVFSIWSVFVSAVGFAVLYRRQTSTMFMILFTIFLLITAVFAVVIPGMFSRG
jgi:hypothetical protein